MFGFRKSVRRRGGGAFGTTNLRNAAIAGVGLLALRWWRNRRGTSETTRPVEPTTPRNTDETTWS